jgi:hypothetical protein
MPIRQKMYPMRFTPKGLVDALDATDKFPGACVQLANLIFDQSNPEIMVSRPGVGSGITSFAGFSSPGVVSVHITVGSVTYGMISTALNAGKDEPFAYDNAAGAFIAITGVTNANSPTTQSSTGAWTPPTMAVVSTQIIVTHPGFAGGATKFGVIDITVPAAPTWTATDTVTNALPSVPTWVQNYRNRAYFGCGNTVPYSDVLVPTTRTNASQALTIGDTAATLCAAGLPVQTTSSGIVAALIIFKGFQTWQVTGDAATSDLALNFLSLTIGCSAPRSIQQSQLGTYFASNSGPKIIDQFAVIRDVLRGQQETESDIQAPWQNAVVPSRMASGYAGSIYRICMETVINGADVTNDYWFDEHRRRWTGPHSFSYDCASQYQNYLILSSNAVPGKLFKSELVPSLGSVYNDNGTQITSTLQSSTFPKTGHMITKQVVESTLELASAGGAASYAITAQDDLGNTLNTCQISILPAGGLWGSVVWGAFTWMSTINKPTTYTVPWGIPIVFKKMALFITASAASALALGTFMARFQDTGYTNPR